MENYYEISVQSFVHGSLTTSSTMRQMKQMLQNREENLEEMLPPYQMHSDVSSHTIVCYSTSLFCVIRSGGSDLFLILVFHRMRYVYCCLRSLLRIIELEKLSAIPADSYVPD